LLQYSGIFSDRKFTDDGSTVAADGNGCRFSRFELEPFGMRKRLTLGFPGLTENDPLSDV
jgi:hypothetical protein